MTLQLSKISTEHSNLINSEGSILGLYNDKITGDLYLRGKTNEVGTYLLCRTNLFRFGLFLSSRISLLELYHLSYDEHYLCQSSDSFKGRFLEVENLEAPSELSHLEYANSLYSCISENTRPEITPGELLNNLPKYNFHSTDKIQHLEIVDAMWNLCKTDNKYLNLVSIEDEKINPYDYDYVESYSKKFKAKIYARTNPVVLKLFLTSRITVSELMKCYIHEPYIILIDSAYKLSDYTNEVEQIVDTIKFARRIHYTLPPEFQSSIPLEQLKIYAGSLINGRGTIPNGFKRNKNVDLVIDY